MWFVSQRSGVVYIEEENEKKGGVLDAKGTEFSEIEPLESLCRYL